MRERVHQVWAQLEARSIAAPGISRVRLSATATPDLYLALRYPECTRTVMLRLPLSVLQETASGFVQLRGVRTRPLPDPDDDRYGFASLVLVEPRLSDLFDVLIEDLWEALRDISRPAKQGRVLNDRLKHWHALFDRYSGEGLSFAARMGLFGELRWIRTLIDAGVAADTAIGAWQGSPGGDQDFVRGSAGVELKTTIGASVLHVSSERQLDDAAFEMLALVHQTVRIDLGGHSLPSEINTIRTLLQPQSLACEVFEARISQVGYSESAIDSYEDVRYIHEGTAAYRVTGRFPRITPDLALPGVRDVQYSIDIKSCKHFQMPVNDVVHLFT